MSRMMDPLRMADSIDCMVPVPAAPPSFVLAKHHFPLEPSPRARLTDSPTKQDGGTPP